MIRTLLLLATLSVASLLAAERVLWTSSHVHGSPEPPAPFRVERAFPKVTFKEPVDAVTIPGTNRIAVVQQHGRIFSLTNDDTIEKADLFADLKQYDPDASESYAITFHPHFAENRFAYVCIILDARGKPNRENGSRIVRFRVTESDPPRLDITSGTTIFTWLAGGHNGGAIRFGPDGMLYISTGDSEVPEPPDPKATGQDITDVLASVLRIDVDHPGRDRPYGIPQDNPFVATPGARGEVWAYGFRNPWRFSFDSKSGALWVGDVGWELWEMVYRVQRGGNYGWSITEGSHQDVRPDRPRGPTPILPPVVAHSHEEAASITGGEVYHGKKMPELEGAYIYGDWQVGTFWSLRTEGDRVTEHRELCRSTLLPTAFGVDPDGELLICDQGTGGLWRIARNPLAGKESSFPRRLSETGLFTNTPKQSIAAGVVPYTVNAERWADYAHAERWVAVPSAENVTIAKKEFGVLAAGRWVYPADTVLTKTYALEMEQGNPASRRAVETQLLHYDGEQWAAYSYRWNDEQTDAELVPSNGAEVKFKVKDPAAPGGMRDQTWRYFSRAECLRCHNMWVNFAPGFSPPQLDHTDATTGKSQFDILTELGLTPGRTKAKPGALEAKLLRPYEAVADLELRARSYLHANCSTCHRFGGGGSVPSRMDIETPLTEARLIGVKPVQGDLNLPDGRVIAPGDPCRSVLLYRLTTGGRGHMPYLGGRLVDDRGVQLARDWIASLKPEQNVSDAVKQQRSGEQEALKRIAGGDLGALDELLNTASGTFSVALAVIDGTLHDDMRQQAIAKGSALPDPLRRDLFERFLPESQRRKVLGPEIQPEAIVSAKGDVERGKTLFAAICAACHHAGDTGIDFGPDLSHIAGKYDRAGLLDQILHPAKVIDPQWGLATVSMKSGDTLTGFIAARSDQSTTLKLAGGAKREVPAADIEKSNTVRVSLMPEGLLQSLTLQEATDLLEFIASLR